VTFREAIARLRVPIGFVCAGIALVLAIPTPLSCLLGGAVAAGGEMLRVWAAGHIQKGREITRSGPYRYVRHPLYLGSTLMALGFALAARRPVIFALVLGYLALTLWAAIRTEEAWLNARFSGDYDKYRRREIPPVERSFAWARAWQNREYRSVVGLLIVFAYLVARATVRHG
jgi:protein-S-isoprenylcysteine O-methyltransferase Ste14